MTARAGGRKPINSTAWMFTTEAGPKADAVAVMPE
jgi:hypothetical protein